MIRLLLLCCWWDGQGAANSIYLHIRKAVRTVRYSHQTTLNLTTRHRLPLLWSHVFTRDVVTWISWFRFDRTWTSGPVLERLKTWSTVLYCSYMMCKLFHGRQPENTHTFNHDCCCHGGTTNHLTQNCRKVLQHKWRTTWYLIYL